MIVVFDRDADAFDTNGLGALDPISCHVAETLNGQWELTLEHEYDGLKSARLQIGNIIRAPVPAGYTPAVDTPYSGAREIWAVSSNVLYIRSGPDLSYKTIGQYPHATEVVVLNKTSAQWYEVTTPDGKHGWMYAPYLQYVRTEGTPGEAEDEVKKPQALRDQLFRIYRLEPGVNTVTVKARHIFYDLMCNILDEYKPEEATGAIVAQGIMSHCRSDHSFTMYSDLTTTCSADFTHKNPVDAILGSGGLCEAWKGELARDWWDVYVVDRVGRDTDIEIRQGKNLISLLGEYDITETATRIIPIGRTNTGEKLYLPELYVENTTDPKDYGAPRWMTLDRSDLKVGEEGTQTQVYDKLRAAAQDEFDKGRDDVSVSMEVEFVNLGDTVEYADYGILYDISIGDSVRVICENAGVEERLRMTEYEYDCLAKRYTVMKLEKKKSLNE